MYECEYKQNIICDVFPKFVSARKLTVLKTSVGILVVQPSEMPLS